MLFHYTWQARGVFPAAHPIAYGLFWGGYGVELFFAISGFVIFMTLERTGRTTDFVVSRASRLFPAYWAGILVTSLMVALLGASSLSQPGWVIAANMSMLQGFLYLPSVDGVYLSLTIELAFYFCMWTIWRTRQLDRIETLLLGWIALKLFWWLVPVLPSRLGLLLAVDYIAFFAIGIATYRVRQGQRSLLQQAPVLLWGFIVTLITGGGEGALVHGIVLLVFLALISGRLVWLNIPALIWLGAISYPLYLVHQLCGYAVIAQLEALGLSPELALLLTIAAVLALAQAIHLLVEQPALALFRGNWRRRQALSV
jgi:peptidoglycan/LPS O-acetylase OafA/YrhL